MYAPVMISDADLPSRTVFLVGERGRVQELTSDDSAQQARLYFEESCIWFSAAEPGPRDPRLPSHPDLGGSARPRAAAGYDRRTLEALSEALTHEVDFADWLSDRLRELSDLLGGRHTLISRHPHSWAANHLNDLTQPVTDGPGDVWPTWPAIDPATLPDVDTAGWLLVPGVAACGFMEGLEAETAAAARLADAIADRANNGPPWRACGVTELLPQFVPLQLTSQLDADLATVRSLAGTDEVAALFRPPSADADLAALLRIAVDADRRQLDVIDVGVAATAAYRRVLDTFGLPFETQWYQAMFE
ncbi:hypothetical protein GCM10029964_069930 [Kibdelosporangium lantanae]